MDLFEIALSACQHLIIAVTNPDAGARHPETTSKHRHTEAANPFTYFERTRLLESAMRNRGLAERITIVPFDLTRPAVWPDYVPHSARQYVRTYGEWEREKARRLEQAGYSVTLLQGDPQERLSATDIRASMQAGGEWRALVPAASIALLDEYLASRPRA